MPLSPRQHLSHGPTLSNDHPPTEWKHVKPGEEVSFLIEERQKTRHKVRESHNIMSSFSVLRLLSRCHWVSLMPSYCPSFHSVVWVSRVNFCRSMSADTVFCQVFIALLTGNFPSTTNLANAFTQSPSSFNSTWPCHLSLHLITPPNASTPMLLFSSVLSCLSFRETRHIHMIILIYVLSILDFVKEGTVCPYLGVTQPRALWDKIIFLWRALEVYY